MLLMGLALAPKRLCTHIRPTYGAENCRDSESAKVDLQLSSSEPPRASDAERRVVITDGNRDTAKDDGGHNQHEGGDYRSTLR